MKPLPDQRGVVAWGALAVAFLVAQQVTGKATRDALFLSHHPPTALPLVTIASALVAVASALEVGRLLARRAPRQVVPALIGLNAALLLGQFLLALAAPRVAAVLVYFQIAASGGTLLSGYWSVVNERFDPWTAKRVVGRLGLGASLGGVAGGVAAYALAGTLSLPLMLLLTAALSVAALVGLVLFAGHAERPEERGASAALSAFGTIRSVPYLRLIATLVALAAAAETLLDYVLKSRASASLAPGPELMAFFAAYHMGMGLLALAGQTLLTRPALLHLGLAGSVALRPLAVAAASLVAFFDLRLWSAVLGRGCHDVLSNSVFRSGYELLYTPLPAAEKRATKQVVDVAFEKLGALAGGALTLAAVSLVAAPERLFLLLAGAASVVALALTRRLHRGYVKTLEQGLRAGEVRLDPDEVVDSTTRFTLAHLAHAPAASGALGATQARTASGDAPSEPRDPLLGRIADLRSGDARRIREALHDLEALDPVLVAHLLPLVARNDVYLVVLRALRALGPRCSGQILDALLDVRTDPNVRRRLPRVLKAAPGPRALEGLLRGLDDPRPDVRASCVVALASIVGRSPELRVPRDAVFAALRRELAEPHAPGPGGTRTAPADLRWTQVFGLLSLVLEREPVQIAARALRGSDAVLRGTALEYLANVLPPDLRGVMLALFEAPAVGRARPREEVLTDLMRSGGSLAAASRRRRRAPRPAE